jgi:hypothetical protein
MGFRIFRRLPNAKKIDADDARKAGLGGAADDARKAGLGGAADDNKLNIKARWMTAEEQEGQIAASMARERQRALDEARATDAAVRTESDTNHADAIAALVAKYLSNNMVNSRFVPDFIERRIYTNMITLIVGLLTETLASSNLCILGHRLEVNLVPVGGDLST